MKSLVIVVLCLVGLALSKEFLSNKMLLVTLEDPPSTWRFAVGGSKAVRDNYVMNFEKLEEYDVKGNMVKSILIGPKFKFATTPSSKDNYNQISALGSLPECEKCSFEFVVRVYNSSKDTKDALFSDMSEEEEVTAQSMLFGVAIVGYEFKDKNNTLSLVSSVVATTSVNEEKVNGTKIRKNNDTGVEALTFLFGTSKNQTFFMNFPEEISVDDKVTSKGFFVTATNTVPGRLDVTYQLPYFEKTVFMDPDVGFQDHSLSSSSSKSHSKIWIYVAIIGGVIAAVILAAIVITIVRRQRKSTYEEI